MGSFSSGFFLCREGGRIYSLVGRIWCFSSDFCMHVGDKGAGYILYTKV